MAISVGVEEDLLPLSALMHQRGVVHRIFEENGRQVVKVQRAEQAPQVAALYQAWRAGEVRIELSAKAQRASYPAPHWAEHHRIFADLPACSHGLAGSTNVHPIPDC